MLERHDTIEAVLADGLVASNIGPTGHRLIHNSTSELVGLWWCSPGPNREPHSAMSGSGESIHVVGNPISTQGLSDPAACVAKLKPNEMSRHLIGPYAVLKVERDGIVIIPDVCGYEVVYVVDEPGISVASNRPELVARIMSAVGRPLSKDIESVCAHTFAGWSDGAGTGYGGMKRLESWSWVRLHRGSITRHRMEGSPTWRTRSPTGDYETALRSSVDVTTRAIGTIAATESSSKVLDLTGGRDSRLTLAATMRSGLIDRFQVRTIGGKKVADVRRAAEIAQRLGIRHEYGFPNPPNSDDFSDRFSTYVTATCGCVNAFDVHPVATTLDECRIQGLTGELMREGYLKGVRGQDASGAESMVLKGFQHSRGQFLNRDALAHMKGRFRSFASDVDDEFVDVDDYSQHYYATIRLRARFEQASSFWITDNFLPLYSHEILNLRSFADSGRTLSHIHSDLTRALYKEADTIPYIGEEPEGYVDSLFDNEPKPETKSLMPLLQAQQVESRRPFLEELASDAANPAWEYLDKVAVRSAIGNMNDIGWSARRRLYGAMTALCWLGDS